MNAECNTKNGNLATAVSEIDFVTADGELRTFSRAKTPTEFPAVAKKSLSWVYEILIFSGIASPESPYETI